jgi:omega-6 fatty acid desaturase (delta-12 desaturase)
MTAPDDRKAQNSSMTTASVNSIDSTEALGGHGAHSEAENSAWRAQLAPYKKASWKSSLIQVANTALPFLGLWALMVLALPISYWITLALAIPTAFFFIRLFILQHDCGHGSFFPSRAANNVLGAMLGVVTLFPYGYWRRTHAIHHATNGNLDDREFGDIRTLTVREYEALSPFGRLMYRLYRHPLVLFGVGPAYQFIVKHRFPFDIPLSWKREWRSVLLTNVAITAVFGSLILALGWKAILLVHLPVVMIAGAMGVWLFYVQHQFEDTYWEHENAWDYYRAGAHGSSFYDLPKLLHWLTGNIGYHHIHHLSSQIPNYRLAEVFESVPEMQRVTRLTLGQSLRCARLRLWDEDRRHDGELQGSRAAAARRQGAGRSSRARGRARARRIGCTPRPE